jgi:hypothetical protein
MKFPIYSLSSSLNMHLSMLQIVSIAIFLCKRDLFSRGKAMRFSFAILSIPNSNLSLAKIV